MHREILHKLNQQVLSRGLRGAGIECRNMQKFPSRAARNVATHQIRPKRQSHVGVKAHAATLLRANQMKGELS